MIIDLSPLLAELDEEIARAEQALRNAERCLVELRGQRAGVLMAVQRAQLALEQPIVTEGDGDGLDR